jgi:pentatricopeptide repeat protein
LEQALEVLGFVDIGIEFETYIHLLHLCAKMRVLAEGKLVHAHMIETGTKPHILIENNLTNMYVKCSNLKDARQVFDKMRKRNVASWTFMIQGYVEQGHGELALKAFSQMHKEGVKGNHFTLASVLSACASVSTVLDYGEQVHVHAIVAGVYSNVVVGNALLTMYAKCASIEAARRIFNEISKPDIILGSSMIAGYVEHELNWEALEVFLTMQRAGIGVDEFTFSSVLTACASLMALEQGKGIHANIVKTRFKSNGFVGSALVDMYGKCGYVEDARRVFDEMPKRDIVLWNSMMASYSQNEHSEEAITLFSEMQWEGMKPNEYSLTSVLSACKCPEYLKFGRQVHSHMIQTGLDSHLPVENALITMYAKCGTIDSSRLVFDKMIERDVISWTALIVGYVQKMHDEEALKLFCQMQQEGMEPNQFTFATILSACGSLGALENGKQVFAQTIKTGFVATIDVWNSLVTMHAQCGNIEYAKNVFNIAPERDVVTWNAIIAGCVQHGQGKEALQLFEQMQLTGLKPDRITFILIISACRHLGLVDAGHHYLDSMSRDYGIKPEAEHYACIVDLLGHAGHLDQAMDFIKQISVETGVSMWRMLLDACRVHRNTKLGQFAAEHILNLEPQVADTYVLLSNMYAAAGNWDEVAKVRTLMKYRGVIKEPGCSWIEAQNKVHSFVVGDISHPQMEDIYTELEVLSWQMEEAGYKPGTNRVLHDVEDEQNEYLLCHHTVKLAIAFGLISTPIEMPIRIMQNLPVCGDCHNATKLISKIVGRKIVVRDTNRFHHFKDGLCSCGDCW